MSDEKDFSSSNGQDGQVSYDEKNGAEWHEPRRLSVAEATDRKMSVAMNIVENPLRVSGTCL